MSRKKNQKGRRARGTGSIFYHAGRKRWVARKVVNGTAVERWGETQREAIDKLRDALPPDPNTVTVTQWADRWRATLNVRASTKHSYELNLDRHILPALGTKRLADVQTVDVEAMIARLRDKELKVATVRLIIAHCRALFAAAVRSELIPRNPASFARKPRTEAGSIETYTPAQLTTIIATAPQFASGGVIATLAATGMRIGEVLALDVTDYNPVNGTITITKTYSLRFGSGAPKSRHSNRTITVPDVLRPILKEAIGDRTSGPLFRTELGNRRPAQTVMRGWKATLRAAKLAYKKIHTLRHSVATALIGANVPIPDVARFVGDTVATLVRCYVHPTWADPAHTLNRLYGVRKVGELPQTPSNTQEIKAAAG